MIDTEFLNYKYFPIIRTRMAELQGLAYLDDEAKDKLAPIITLGKWRNSEDIDKSIEKIIDCLSDRPYILDLTDDVQHQNSAIKELKDPSGNFSKWVDFVEENEKIIPVVQFTIGAKNREIVRQAVELENIGRRPVFRIKDFSKDLGLTLSSLYALKSPERALVIFDASYIRDISTKGVKAGILENILKSLNIIVDELPEVPRVLAGTSFPRSVTSFLEKGLETSGKIDILENVLFDEIGSDIVLYGDHASIHSVVYDDMGGVFLPRIDVPDDGFWHFERRPRTKKEGYEDASKALLEKFPYLKEDKSWGAQMIRNTAEKTEKTINAPVTAVAVRVNLHLNYQLKVQNSTTENFDEEDWDF